MDHQTDVAKLRLAQFVGKHHPRLRRRGVGRHGGDQRLRRVGLPGRQGAGRPLPAHQPQQARPAAGLGHLLQRVELVLGRLASPAGVVDPRHGNEGDGHEIEHRRLGDQLLMRHEQRLGGIQFVGLVQGPDMAGGHRRRGQHAVEPDRRLRRRRVERGQRAGQIALQHLADAGHAHFVAAAERRDAAFGVQARVTQRDARLLEVAQRQGAHALQVGGRGALEGIKAGLVDLLDVDPLRAAKGLAEVIGRDGGHRQNDLGLDAPFTLHAQQRGMDGPEGRAPPQKDVHVRHLDGQRRARGDLLQRQRADPALQGDQLPLGDQGAAPFVEHVGRQRQRPGRQRVVYAFGPHLFSRIPARGPQMHLARGLGLAGTELVRQTFCEQAVVLEPVKIDIERAQEQAVALQLFKQRLGVVKPGDGLAQRRTQSRQQRGAQQEVLHVR